ncbi:MAG: phenylalanine--tRNA ligase subunit alpha, partial [Thermodesulfobacteriota bacterium]
MTEALRVLREQAEAELRQAGTEEAFQAIRTRYLGRKGLLTGLLRNIANVAPAERPQFGKECNEVKEELSARIDELLAGLASSKKDELLLRERIDVTLPGRGVRHGRLHPVTQVREEICRIFAGLGFSVVEGPEVELDYYNFEALNIPKDHPARDMQDTFYVEENIVLRTHTSPVQVRIMEKTRPPVRILSPGRVYRRDSDISHTPMFHQIEGLLVDRGITFGDLKGVLTVFLKQIFGEDTALRFRPSFFPFTEPSAEVDIRCVICRGRGCRVCG